MRDALGTYASRIAHERRTRTCIIAVLAALAVVVVAGVSWQLHYTGIAAANETYCGMEEHTHTDDCYSQVLVCGSDESADHTHTDACYQTQLTCTLPEHIHTVECLIDPTEVDTAHIDWEATLPQLTGIWADDVVAIAQSQLGYTESPTDVILDETGELKGYTCYGDWYGSTHAENDTYANWDATFASFCLSYAGIPESDFPEGSDVNAWIKTLDNSELYVEETQATPGDLIFLDSDKDDVADTVAIVIAEKDGEFTLIQGDSNNAVEQNTLRSDDKAIVGFAVLPEQPEQDELTLNEDTEDATENTATQKEIGQTVEDNSVVESTEDGETAAVTSNRGEGLVMLDSDDDIQMLSEGMGDKLDGDYAYLSNVVMNKGSNENGYAMTTGTEPFDKNDDAGNDQSETNEFLRTFDTATYTVDMTTNVREDAPYGVYKEGNLYFEFVVAGTGDEIEWDTEAMGWLESKNGVYNITTESFNGIDYQVLRGYVTLAAATDEGHAIGNTTQTLSLALRVLAMKNETLIKPDFTFFLAYNNVGLTDEQYDAWGTSSYDGPIVTFDGQDCEEHEEQEWNTVIAPDMIVSAAPRYNLFINVHSTDENFTTVGSFDFSNTGNDYAVNKDAGEKYGRLGAFGIALEVEGKDSTNGLRGAEIPKHGEKIDATFTLDLSSQYTSNGKTYQTDGTKYDDVKTEDGTLSDYAPLIWSFDQNMDGSTQVDNRAIPGSRTYSCGVPFNVYNGTTSRSVYSCSNGGSWYITETDKPGVYEVTIKDCTVNMQQLPRDTTSSGNDTYYSHNINYDPLDDTKNDYWEVKEAVLTAGECWVLEPFYAHEKTAETGDDSTYIASVLNDGSFNVYLEDSELAVTDAQGDTILKKSEGTENQTSQNDDIWTRTMALTKPGSLSQNVIYLKYNGAWDDALIDGCYQNGKDWILQGNQLTVYSCLTHQSAEANATGIAADQMIKFDDAFFEPDGTYKATQTTSRGRTMLWAAKPDGTGWDHKGLSPDQEGYDEEMIYATPDDLIYYSSLSALQNDGKTCVAVLFEYRGLASEQREQDLIYINGHVKDGAEANQVYMITLYGRVWNRDNLAAAMAADPSSEYYNNENGALDALMTIDSGEVETLAKQYIPSKANNAKDYADYPSAYWINGGRDGTSGSNGVTSNTIRNYKKAYYTEKGFDGNGTGVTSGYYYGDSCLLVSYKSGLTIEVAQQTTSQGTVHNKSTFDIDTGQTVVDYVVEPFITRDDGEGESTGVTYDKEVVVTVDLPENLTYIDGSSYIGGEYETTTEGHQGTVTGGTQLTVGEPTTFIYTVGGVEYEVGVTLTLQNNSDGTQTLVYTFTNVPVTGDSAKQLLESIYFSCEISSGAVTNNEQLNVDATITCEADKNIDLDLKDDGEAIVGITVTKNTAVSLVKQADQTAVEVNGEIGFTMDVGDNSDNPMVMVAVDNIPYNGDGSSYFANSGCQVYVTEFSAYDITATRDLSGFYFFYTTDISFADKTSADYPEGEYFVTNLGGSNEAVNPECLRDGWTQIVTDSSEHDTAGHTIYSATNIPANTNIYSIVAVGMIEGNDDINLHVTLELSDPEPGDYVINNLSQQHASTITNEQGETVTTYSDLADNARSTVVGRTISGVVWLDEDVDGGIRTGVYGNEQLLGGVTVTLQVKDESGNWVTAEKLKCADGESAECITTTDAEGYYEFNYLPEGEYRIVFSGTGVGDSSELPYDLSNHDVTIYEATGIDDSVNSKVVRVSGADMIEGILLPEAAVVGSSGSSTYEVPYQNAGYTKSDSFTVDKVWKDVEGNDITGSRTTGSVTAQVTVTGSEGATIRDEEVTLNSGNSWQNTLDDLPYYDGNGKEFNYAVTDFTVDEITGNDGYIVTVGDIIDNGDGSYSVEITNQAGRELPNTGGMGTTIFTIIGLALVGSATALLINRRRKGSPVKGVMP